MNVLDIILLVLLLIAAVAGWRKGIIVQACGIAGLVLGILFAMRFSRTAGDRLGAGEELAPVLGFAAILVVSILVLALIGYLFKKVFRLTGFGIIDRIGGLALSVVKIGLLLTVLTGFFASMNANYRWVDPKEIDDSVVYKPLRAMTDAVFPYLVRAKDKLFEGTPADDTTGRTPAATHEA
ncbi:MAG TPA: CvpA family protein [Candidatus Tidjanibacter gallistercoris]|nr:CvpA family protein [Candidatus Tidjanibacter gallistercoris]